MQQICLQYIGIQHQYHVVSVPLPIREVERKLIQRYLDRLELLSKEQRPFSNPYDYCAPPCCELAAIKSYLLFKSSKFL